MLCFILLFPPFLSLKISLFRLSTTINVRFGALAGAHLRQFPLTSIRQPDNAKILTVGSSKYLITADEGHYATYTRSVHGFDWKDHQAADLLARGF